MCNLTPLSGTLTKKSALQNNAFLRNGIASDKEALKAALESEFEAFPVWAFPDKIQAIIQDCQKNLNAVPDFLGSSLLFVASIAIGNRFRIRIKDNYHQSAAIYIAVVGNPNAGKTFPFAFALTPLEHIERDYKRIYKEAQKQYEQALSAFKALSKEEKATQSEPVAPTFKQLTIQDTTPEALIKGLSDNPEGLGLFRDELAAWVMNFNRYQQGDEEQMWLMLWNNRPYKVNRVGRGSICVEVPFISVGGGVQPETLKKISKGRTNNGFTDRILFAFPSGVQKREQPETDISPDTPQIWFDIIRKILAIPLQLADSELNIPEPRLLWLSQEAKAKFREFDKRNVSLCNEPENEPFAGAWGKLDVYVYRFALIMELLQYACNDSGVLPAEISGLAMQRAIMLCEYFRSQAKKVISLIEDINPLEGLPDNEIGLYHALPEGMFGIKTNLQLAAKFGLKHPTSFRRFLKKCVEKGLMFNPKGGKYEKKF